MRPGHTYNPSYPPGSRYFDPDEQFCTEDQTLCTDDQPCMCCWVDRMDSSEDHA